MQRIESKHIHLRTRSKRLVRRTICFAKTACMRDLVIGLFVNRYEFGRAISQEIHHSETPATFLFDRAKDLTPNSGSCTLSPCDGSSQAQAATITLRP